MEGAAVDHSQRIHATKPMIGLVGGIGAGKSLVATLFAGRGGYIIDADAAGHEALRQPDVRVQVERRFGQM